MSNTRAILDSRILILCLVWLILCSYCTYILPFLVLLSNELERLRVHVRLRRTRRSRKLRTVGRLALDRIVSYSSGCTPEMGDKGKVLKNLQEGKIAHEKG